MNIDVLDLLPNWAWFVLVVALVAAVAFAVPALLA